ncbi:TPA: GTP-binding protein, partial [Pseudomonas aeruginosa]|nr:GTP-binding protein [Pseudomonas aeruginosa]
MPLEQHPLSREFPDFHAELKQLHGNDAHFTRLATDYESLDKRIYEVEGGR